VFTELARQRPADGKYLPLADGDGLRSSEISWERALEAWAEHASENLKIPLLHVAQPKFEEIMIRAALKKTAGRKRDAAELLGWGRNTLTRKITELELTDLR
jgi:two-component system nitrogen regulation response regulator GlnG